MINTQSKLYTILSTLFDIYSILFVKYFNKCFKTVISRVVAIYALFGRLWAKKCSFGSNTVFLGQEVHYDMVHIAYYTEFNLQICNNAQKQRICRKISKDAPDEHICANFALA